MVHAWLAIPRTIDGIPLAESDLVQFVQLIDLPSDESVVVGVRVRRQKHASPIDTCTKRFQVTLSQKIRPVSSWGPKDVQLTVAIGGKYFSQ